MSIYKDINYLDRFYRSLHFKGFKYITNERQQELDQIVLNWYDFFHAENLEMLELMSSVTKFFNAYEEVMNLKTDDEFLYFYINIVDPELLLLECYESANKKEDIKKLCYINFKIYDARLIFIEKHYNKIFNKYHKDSLWTLERIKKEY